MKLTFESIPNVQAVKMISATSTYGTGFWTGICTGCANLCGTECKRLGKKINKAKTSATNELMAKAAAANADGIMEIRYQISGKTVFMYGIAYKMTGGNTPPANQTYTAPAQQAYTAPAQQAYTAPAQQAYTAPAQQAQTAPVQTKSAHVNYANNNYDTWECKNCGTQNKSFTSMCKKCGQYKSR